MDSNSTEFANEWILIAEDDLRWAKASFEDGFFSRVCFVCQQATEKVLKGFLYGNNVYQKTHSLLRLMDLCAKINSSFLELKNDLTILDPYYLETRYPDMGDIDQFDKKELAQEALLASERVIEFVKKHMKTSSHV